MVSHPATFSNPSGGGGSVWGLSSASSADPGQREPRNFSADKFRTPNATAAEASLPRLLIIKKLRHQRVIFFVFIFFQNLTERLVRNGAVFFLFVIIIAIRHIFMIVPLNTTILLSGNHRAIM